MLITNFASFDQYSERKSYIQGNLWLRPSFPQIERLIAGYSGDIWDNAHTLG